MQEVTELFATHFRTRVFATSKGRKELEKLIPMELLALFQIRSEKEFQGYAGESLRDEGKGTHAFGTRTWKVRIAGYFYSQDRSIFVVCGVYNKQGQKRGQAGDGVAERTAAIKMEGVQFPTQSKST